MKTTASGKGFLRQKPQALVDKELTSSKQTGKTASTEKCKITDNPLEKRFIKVPSQTPPVGLQVDNAATEGNEKSLKRKKDVAFGEDTGIEHKKRKVTPEQATFPVVRHDDPKAESSEAAMRQPKPRGIVNGQLACYINSVLQAIANIPEMVEHYRGLADKMTPEVTEFLALNAKNLEYESIARVRLKVLLQKNKSKM